MGSIIPAMMGFSLCVCVRVCVCVFACEHDRGREGGMQGGILEKASEMSALLILSPCNLS